MRGTQVSRVVRQAVEWVIQRHVHGQTVAGLHLGGAQKIDAGRHGERDLPLPLRRADVIDEGRVCRGVEYRLTLSVGEGRRKYRRGRRRTHRFARQSSTSQAIHLGIWTPASP